MILPNDANPKPDGIFGKDTDPRPYRLALERIGVPASDAAFVAGSGYDLIGTAAVGLRSYWHNRVGLPRPAGAPPADFESPTLDHLIPWLEGRLA
jgi:2-haloacid dehalogenase